MLHFSYDYELLKLDLVVGQVFTLSYQHHQYLFLKPHYMYADYKETQSGLLVFRVGSSLITSIN